MISRWTRLCFFPALLLLVSAEPGAARNAAPISIAAALRDGDGNHIPDRAGETVTVRARVIAHPRTVGGTTTLVNVQDRTGGLMLVSQNAAALARDLRPGDVVEARGEIHQYRGTEELIVGDLRRVARSDIPKPMHVTAIDLRGERFGGRLVHLTGELHVARDADEQLRLELEDASGIIPVSVPTGLGTPQFQERLLRGGPVELVGIAGQSTEDPRYNSGYLLAPRSPADFGFTPIPPYRAIGLSALLLALGGLAAYLWVRRRWAERRAREMTLLAEGLRSSEQALRESEERLRRAERHAREMAERMRAVASAASGVITAESLDALQVVLRDACQRVILFDVFTFSLYDAEARTLHFLADPWLEEPPVTRAVAGTPSEWVVRERRSLVTLRATDPRGDGSAPCGEPRRSESVVRSPILVGERVLGVISVQSYVPDSYGERDVEVLETVAALAATALSSLQLLSERRASEEAVRESEARYRLLFDGGNDAVFVYGIDAEGNTTPFREVNHVACQRLGYTREELLRHSPLDFDAPEDLPAARLGLERLLSERHLLAERVHIARDGSRIPVEVNARVIDLHGQPTVISIARDIRERKQAEEALRQSEERLRQSQKMEAVGTLAGGVAHDFNNLLTVIKGNAEILLLELPDDDPARGDIAEIQRAADRAAALTRQLLAFSRKQVLQPRVLALDEVASELAPMLRRIIGEDVEMHTVAAPDLAPVRADPGQIQQVIMNLAANARDAMPRGGTLNIELANVDLDAAAAADLPGLAPGSYVMLAVRDTGCGIDPATRAQIFDPFFTTKPQGTGLGLSTVYGIVQQSGGAIEVGSEPGSGTTFRIFLPRVEPPSGAQQDTADPRTRAGGAETVLLVEDEDAVRTLARKVLERSGYRVLDAPSGAHALRLCGERGERVDLLLTDVVMPGMSGPTLAEELGTRWPGLRVLFISGYTDDALGKHGVLQTGVHFLEKPFPPDALARKVREVLDAPPEASVQPPPGAQFAPLGTIFHTG